MSQTKLIASVRSPFYLRIFMFCFGAMMTGGGIWIFWGETAGPYLEWKRVQEWEEVPCVIEYHEARADPPWRMVRYRYNFQGQEYVGERYGFFDPAYFSEPEHMTRNEVGSTSTCYVNPDKPAEAYLYREYEPQTLWAFVPLILFSFFGALLLIGCFLSDHAGQTVSDWRPKPTKAQRKSSRYLFPGGSKRFSGTGYFVLAAGLFALPSYFLYYFLTNEMPFEELVAMTLLASFLALLGLLCLFGGIRRLIAYWQPRPRLIVEPDTLHPGDVGTITWHFRGDITHLEVFRLALEGREEVEYYRSKQHVQLESVFERIAVLEAELAKDAVKGQARFTIPERTMHSMDLTESRIVWYVKMELRWNKRPDYTEDYPVQVYPLNSEVRTKV